MFVICKEIFDQDKFLTLVKISKRGFNTVEDAEAYLKNCAKVKDGSDCGDPIEYYEFGAKTYYNVMKNNEPERFTELTSIIDPDVRPFVRHTPNY